MHPSTRGAPHALLSLSLGLLAPLAAWAAPQATARVPRAFLEGDFYMNTVLDGQQLGDDDRNEDEADLAQTVTDLERVRFEVQQRFLAVRLAGDAIHNPDDHGEVAGLAARFPMQDQGDSLEVSFGDDRSPLVVREYTYTWEGARKQVGVTFEASGDHDFEGFEVDEEAGYLTFVRTVELVSREPSIRRTARLRYNFLRVPSETSFVPRRDDGEDLAFTTSGVVMAEPETGYLEKQAFLDRIDHQAGFVFTLHPSIPDEFRPAVVAAIEAWNDVFEERTGTRPLGTRDGSWDETPGDLRHHVIYFKRTGFMDSDYSAITPSVSIKETGQVIDSDILVNAVGLMRDYRAALKAEAEKADEPEDEGAAPAGDDTPGDDGAAPVDGDPPSGTDGADDSTGADGTETGPAPAAAPSAHASRSRRRHGRRRGAHHLPPFQVHGRGLEMVRAGRDLSGHGGQPERFPRLIDLVQPRFSGDAESGAPPPAPPSVHEAFSIKVQGLIVHEIGHTLGLPHNFAGSADLENIPEGRKSTTIMDYLVEGPRHYLPGPYDAVMIGYLYADEVREGEGPFLVSRDTRTDPLANQWDEGDPLAFYRDRAEKLLAPLHDGGEFEGSAGKSVGRFARMLERDLAPIAKFVNNIDDERSDQALEFLMDLLALPPAPEGVERDRARASAVRRLGAWYLLHAGDETGAGLDRRQTNVVVERMAEAVLDGAEVLEADRLSMVDMLRQLDGAAAYRALERLEGELSAGGAATASAAEAGAADDEVLFAVQKAKRALMSSD